MIARPAPAPTDLVHVDPDEVVLVEGVGAALYDGRVAIPLDEDHVEAIRALGVVEPVVGRRRAGRIEIIDGRLRVRWLREANSRNAAEGRPRLLLPVVFRERGDDDAREVAVALNEIRVGDSLLTKARKAGRLKALGWKQVRIARAFGVTHVTVVKWLYLVNLTPELQAALERGDLPVDAARELGRLPAAEQPAAVDRVVRETDAMRLKRTRDWLHRSAGQQGGSANGVPAGRGGRGGRGGRDHETVRFRTGHRLKDLARWVIEVDRQALPPSFGILLLWCSHDPETSPEDVVRVFPRLAPFFAAT